MKLEEIINQYRYTHMPYIFYEDGNPRMLFTVMQENFWKLYYTDGEKSYKVQTQLDEILGSKRYHMCQPTCYKQNNIYKMSFCIQFRNVISLYYCQTQDLTKLDNLILVKKSCYGGCVSPSYIMINETNDEIYIFKKPQIITEIDNFSHFEIIHQYVMTHPHLARISYIYNHEKYIIISYADPKYIDKYGSLYINMDQPKQQRLLYDSDETPLYKATADPVTETVYYGKKIGNMFEQRKVTKISSSNIIVKDCNWLKIIN